MNTKTGRLVTYDNGKPFMKSHSTMRIWSRDVIRQIKNVISPLLQGKWPPNFAGSWFMGRVTYPWSWGDVTNWKRNISSSENPMATKLIRAATSVKRNPPRKSHDTLIMWSREVIRQMSSSTIPITTKPLSFSHDPLISQSPDKIKILYSHFHIPSFMKIRVVNLLELKFTRNIC